MQVLKRPIIPSDLLRWMHYAQFIRSLSLRPMWDARSPEYYNNIYPLLHSVSMVIPLDGHLLCPGVRSVDSQDNFGLLRWLPLFIGDQTTRLVVGLEAPTKKDQRLLRSLPERYPHIEDFTFRRITWMTTDSPDYHAVPRMLSDMVRGWNHLTIFESNIGFPRDALTHLATLPKLHTLSIVIWDINCVSETLASSTPTFRKLDKLTLSCRSWTAVQKFFAMATSYPYLRVIDLIISVEVSDQDFPVAAFFRSLTASCTHSVLEEILVRHDHYLACPSRDWRGSLMHQDVLKSLCQFYKMKKITILTHHHYDLENESLHHIVSSWPSLRELHLGCYGWNGQSKISLAGLKKMTRCCPSLRKISLAIDATIPNPTLESTKTKDEIQEIDFQDSAIEDPTLLADHLCNMFSNLKEILFWSDVQMDISNLGEETKSQYLERWDEVARLVAIRRGSL